MANVLDVARYFLSLSKESTPYAITPLKLQKLAYYAQGFHLRDHKVRLFRDDILAWDHGPVVYRLWTEYNRYRYLTIPNKPFNNYDEFTEEEKLKDIEIKTIEKVWKNYGKLDGKYLEEMTHQEDPWLFTDKDDVIDINLIRDYFASQLVLN